MPCGRGHLKFPDQGSNLRSLHWQFRALTNGLPGKSLKVRFDEAPTVCQLLGQALRRSERNSNPSQLYEAASLYHFTEEKNKAQRG